MRNSKGQFLKGYIPDNCFKKGIIPWNKGVKCLEETRIKISNTLRGNIPWNKGLTKKDQRVLKNTMNTGLSLRGKPSGRKGVKLSKEHRKKLILVQTGKFGILSKNWQGGITPIHTKIRNSNEYQEWRNAVFVKDDYTCQKCGLRGVNLNAHHIKSFSKHPELRLSLLNGLTLCFDCHKIIKKIKFDNISTGVERTK